MEKAGEAIEAPARLGVGPTRFCAYAAASTFRPRRRRGGTSGSGLEAAPLRGVRASGSFLLVPEEAARRFLAPLPTSLLRERLGGEGREAERLVAVLERLGVRALGKLAALPRAQLADRFGPLGLRAHELACGEDTPLRPRRAHEEIVQWLELPEAVSGGQLERGLELLIERLLAQPARRGRAIRALRIEARLAAGGSWRMDVTPRQATASAERLRLVLGPILAGLPAPATGLGLRALELGAAGGEQASLTRDERERRLERLAEAVRQARAACGRDAVLRVLEVDLGSHVPERWALLAPYTEPADPRDGSRGGERR
jgi:protein ImuB